MDIPRTADEAAQVLGVLAAAPVELEVPALNALGERTTQRQRAMVPNPPAEAGDTPWQMLTSQWSWASSGSTQRLPIVPVMGCSF